MYEELEVIITDNGLGRAAIVKRKDGLLQIFVHWLWDSEARQAFNAAESMPKNWDEFEYHEGDLYQELEPEPGLYNDLQLARIAVRSLPGFHET